MDVHTQIDDDLDLTGQQTPIEAVFGDAQQHHSAQMACRFIDAHLIAETSQIVGGGQTRWATSHDADALGTLDSGRRCDLAPQATVVRFRAKPLRDEPLECPDGDRPVDLASTTGVLAWSRADTAAYRCEGIGQPGGEVGEFVIAVCNCRNVHAGIRMDRAGGQAGDVLVVVLQGRPEDEVTRHQIRSRFCSHLRAANPTASGTSHAADPTRSDTQREAPATAFHETIHDGNQAVASTK